MNQWKTKGLGKWREEDRMNQWKYEGMGGGGLNLVVGVDIDQQHDPEEELVGE